MAIRLDDNGSATRKRGNRLAVATLAFGVVGLILGVLSPPALLLGFVAVVLGAGTPWAEGASGPARRPLA
jgi:hypothetical protein